MQVVPGPEGTARLSRRLPVVGRASPRILARSSATSDQGADALLEIDERQRAPVRIAAHDRGRAAGSRQNGGRRHQQGRAVARAHDAVDALVEADDIRDARPARAEKDDDALVDRELGRADDDAAEAAERPAGDEELDGAA